jgi:hypothetical protein
VISSMEEEFVMTFLQALKTKLKSKDLPVLASTFYCNYMLPCRKENMNLDVKKTRYKKIAVFLREQASEGMIVLKEEKDVVTIQDVNFKHDKVKNHVKWPVEYEVGYLEKLALLEAAADSKTFSPPIIKELCRPSVPLYPIFCAMGVSTEKECYFTVAEVKKVFDDYIKKMGLVYKKTQVSIYVHQMNF